MTSLNQFATFIGLAVSVASLSTASAGVSDTVAETLPKVAKLFGAGGLRYLPAHSTGTIISSDGHIVTVWNHVLDTPVVTVVLDDGRRFDGKLVGADAEQDIAVLKIEAEGLPHFDLTQAADAGPGTRVLGFSNMYKVATGGEPVSVQMGVVAAVTNLDARRGRWPTPYNGRAYVVDAITNTSGAGGGALTTIDGRLLGFVGREVKGRDSNVWLNYAMPARDLRQTIERIISGDYTPEDTSNRPDGLSELGDPTRLGLRLVPDVVPRTPAYIEEVLVDGPATSLGLQPDDLIVSLDGQLVPSIAILRDQLALIESGVKIRLVVRRGRELVEVELRLP